MPEGHPQTAEINSPLPLAGEGQGEGGLLIFPLTSILSPEGRGEPRGVIFYDNLKKPSFLTKAGIQFFYSK
jgi:hypothetical protein